MNLLSKKNQTKVYNPSCVAQYLLKFENDPNMSFESFKAVEMNIKPLEDILHLQELFMHKWIKPKLLELATNGFTLAARRDYLQFNSTIMGQLYDAAKNMRLGEVDPFLIDVVLAFLLHAGYILIKDRSGEKLELEITNKFHKNEV
jgi:hypothetical protein